MATFVTAEQGTPTAATLDRRVAPQAGRLSAVLWTLQALLALIFLCTGVMKLAMPLDLLLAQMQLPFPGWFVRFLGAAELLGALGLVLPGLTRVLPRLTPLAASGLVLIMAGATVITLLIGGGATALMPLLLGVLAAYVAFARVRLAPQTGR